MKTNFKSTLFRLFRTHRAYSPEEILSAGGATAFGKKSGRDNKKLVRSLSSSPKTEPFSKKEWEDTMKQLHVIK